MAAEDTIRSGNLVWRNIESPTEEALKNLKKRYHFHELDLEDCLSKTESPKIEEYPDYVFVVFHFPQKDLKTDHISLESLNVFLGNRYLITLSSGRIKKLEDLFQSMKEDGSLRRDSFKKGSGYLLYLLLNELFGMYTPYVAQVRRDIREVEEDIFEGKIQKDRLYDIMSVKRQIITLRRNLAPHTPIVLALEKLHKRFINKQMELYFDDVADKINRAKNSLEEMNATMETLHNANESLTSHNTNRVMKVLTIFSVTLLPLNLLAGIYGMNIDLPLAQKEEAFLMLVGIMAGVFVLTLMFFKMKRFL